MEIKGELFNTAMVQAILANRKRATRRPIRYIPECFNLGYPSKCKEDYFYNIEMNSLYCKDCGANLVYSPEGKEVLNYVRPKYQVGDIMYVRETWATIFGRYIYKAESPHLTDLTGWKWKPSIHMPKEAARIFQKITGMRAEKLHDITEEQSIAEGIRIGMTSNYSAYFSCRDAFRFLWDSIYDSQGYGWDVNPWVWVYEFEATEKE